MAPLQEFDTVFTLGQDNLLNIGKNSGELNLIILIPKTEARSAETEVTLNRIILDRIQNPDALDSVLQNFQKKSSNKIKKMRIKFEIFHLESGQLLSQGFSNTICDSSSKEYGVMDFSLATPLRSCARGGRKVFMVAQGQIAQDVEPRFLLYDENDKRLTSMEHILIQPNDPRIPDKKNVSVLKEMVIFITPPQEEESVAMIMKNRWTVKLAGVRKSDGYESEKKFDFNYVPSDFYDPCIFCSLKPDGIDGFATLPEPISPARPGVKKRKMPEKTKGKDIVERKRLVGEDLAKTFPKVKTPAMLAKPKHSVEPALLKLKPLSMLRQERSGGGVGGPPQPRVEMPRNSVLLQHLTQSMTGTRAGSLSRSGPTLTSSAPTREAGPSGQQDSRNSHIEQILNSLQRVSTTSPLTPHIQSPVSPQGQVWSPPSHPAVPQPVVRHPAVPKPVVRHPAIPKPVVRHTLTPLVPAMPHLIDLRKDQERPKLAISNIHSIKEALENPRSEPDRDSAKQSDTILQRLLSSNKTPLDVNNETVPFLIKIEEEETLSIVKPKPPIEQGESKTKITNKSINESKAIKYPVIKNPFVIKLEEEETQNNSSLESGNNSPVETKSYPVRLEPVKENQPSLIRRQYSSEADFQSVFMQSLSSPTSLTSPDSQKDILDMIIEPVPAALNEALQQTNYNYGSMEPRNKL